MSARVRLPTQPTVPDNTPTGTIERDGRRRQVIQVGPSELPPPGDARRDELQRRNEELEARLARLEEALELDNSDPRGQVDISKLAIENEIASKIDMLRVDDALPEYHYYWANFAAMHGLDVTSHQVQGYEVVCGDMIEAKRCRDELGRRKIGDTILMRIPLDKHLELLQLDRLKRQMREDGVMSTLESMGDRWGRRGIRFKPYLDEYQNQHVLKTAQAKQIARQRFNDLLRSGQVPGIRPGA